MRLLVTIETPAGDGLDARHDVVLDYTPDTKVRDLASALGTSRSAALPTNVVALPGASAVPQLMGPADVYLGEALVDPDLTVSDSPIRHGVAIGLGTTSSQREREPHGLVEVRISSGPRAGHVYRLGIGRATVGAGRHCTIRIPELAEEPGLEDLDVVLALDVATDGTITLTPDDDTRGLERSIPLRRHPVTAPIVLEASSVTEARKRRRFGIGRRKMVQEFQLGERIDPTDAVPLVHLDRRPLADATTWPTGQVLGLGPALLERVDITGPDASLSPNAATPELDYNRPPRLHPASGVKEFSVPVEPKRPDKTPIPLLMMVVPLLMGAGLYVFTQSPYGLIMMGASPLMLLASTTGSRRDARRRYLQDMADYQKRRVQVERAALDSLVSERGARRRDFPDPASVLLFATGPRARLWERRRWDSDFLHLRIGTSDLPSEVTLKDPARAAHEGPLLWTAPDVPVTIPMTGVVGIAGPPDRARAVAMWAVAQVAALHSPSDTSLTVLTGHEASPDWDWVKWLPHARNGEDHPRAVRLATDEETQGLEISQLLAELEARRELKEQERGGLPCRIVVLDGARQIRMAPGMISLLKHGPSCGIFFLCLDQTLRELPEECRTVAVWEGNQLNLEVTGERTVDAIRPDLVEDLWLDRIARALAPIRDVSTEDLSAALPAASRLLDVLNLGEPDARGVLAGWSRGGRTTKAAIGESADGVFTIDIRADGPHGLVAGTTGSGKSELLQTMIASLAVGNRPDEFNFVLVDYKGGAAFKDCNLLPHTVGMVTDLDGHLTTRALESLGAELRRREHQLAGADAKDIEDYLAGRDPDDEPMPRLLIVIDEFAALVAELPDFVTGLVDVARRGRSLGVHLILATQRPAGVVSAEIKSNTNLRIALRVTDAGDSDDVIESPAAAQIAKVFPGRAYARLGHSSLIPFQSSRVGGRPAGAGGGAIRFEDMDWDHLPTLGRGPAEETSEQDDVSVPTDLSALVAAITEARDDLGLPPARKPWLEPLPEDLTLDGVLTEFPAATPTADRLTLPFGLVDVPAEQRRDVAAFDLEGGGHLGVIGAPRAGRSTMLRVLAGVVGRYTSPADVHLYGVDCGNNALLPLVGLPHVGAVVTRDQVDRMDRLVSRLRHLISERQQRLAVAGYADVTEQRQHVRGPDRMPYVVVLFDRWEGFFAAYDGLDSGRLVQAWQQILQEGAAVGIRVVMTGDRTLLIGRMSTLFDDKLLMRLVDPTDFTTIGMHSRQIPSNVADGRGFRSEGIRETQIALLAADRVGTAQVAALQTIGREAEERYADVPREQRPFRLDVLPVRIGLEEALALESEPLRDSTLVLGVGGDTLGLRTLDAYEHGPALLVTGARRTGRSTTLRTMATFALQQGWKVVVFTPRLSPLRDLCTSHADVHGPFDTTSEESEVTTLLGKLRDDPAHLLTLVDDVELFGADGWVPNLLEQHLEKLRDSGSALVAAGTPSEMGGIYRGPVVALKRSGSGMMLSPQTSSDADLFGARLARSALGQSLPPGGGFLMRTGSAERVQVIWPE